MICFQRLFHLSLWNIEEGGGAASLQGSQKTIAKSYLGTTLAKKNVSKLIWNYKKIFFNMLLRSDISLVEETGPESSEEYYHELEVQCSEDSFWSQTSTHLHPEQPARCQHCRHWIGQSDLGQQLQHVLNGCRNFSQQVNYHKLL